MFKKIFSIFLVCLMCLSLSVPFAFAAPPSGVLFPDGLTWDDDIILWQDNSSGKYVLMHHISGCMVRNNRVYLDITECSNRIYYVSDDLQTWKTRVDFSTNITVDGREYLRNDFTPDSNLTVLYTSTVLYYTTGAVFAPPSNHPAPPAGVSGSNYALWYEGDTFWCFAGFSPSDSSVVLSDNGYRVYFNLDSPAALYSYSSSGWVLNSENVSGNGLYFTVAGSSSIVYYPERLTFEGSDFFIPPLTLEEAIQGGLMALIAEIARAVLILVGLAVSLMGSLIALIMLKRLFYQFLN